MSCSFWMEYFVHAKSLQFCLFVTLWTVDHQDPLSMGSSKQEYQNGLACLAPGDLPNPRTEPEPLTSLALEDGFFTTTVTWEVGIFWEYSATQNILYMSIK